MSRQRVYLLVAIVASSLYAVWHWYGTVISPDYGRVIRAEGIVMDSRKSYHITSKATVSSLNGIRPGIASAGDMLLGYQRNMMDKTTPPYWGTFYHNGEWRFKLDKSFAHKAGDLGSLLLPFLYRSSDQTCVAPESVLAEEELLREKEYYVNTLSGTPNTRYYLEIKKVGDRYVLPWRDKGIGVQYRLRSNAPDTIGIVFNAPTTGILSSKNFAFQDANKRVGSYRLVYNEDGLSELENLLTAQRVTIDPERFVVEDVMFNVQPRHTFAERLCLSITLLIWIGLICFLWMQARGSFINETSLHLRILVLCFYLLGYPLFAHFHASWSTGRQLLLSFVVPSLLALPSLYPLLPSWLKEQCSSLAAVIKDEIIGKCPKWIKVSLVAIFAFAALAGLWFAENERVFGMIPVLHYVKILILFVFGFLFSEQLSAWLKKQKWPRNKAIVQPFVLMAVSVGASLITRDWGVTMLMCFTLVVYQYVRGREVFELPLWGRVWSFGLGSSIAIYAIISGSVLAVAWMSDILPNEVYRLTYLWANPGNELLYGDMSLGDRESISYLYHNLMLILQHPLGLQDLVVPAQSRSVAYTDYAVHWSLMKGGVFFLVIMLYTFLCFVYTSLVYINCIFRETRDGKVLVSAPKPLRAFVVFWLLFTIMQGIVPICSNLMLPFGFLTGIPFPGVSVSMGDALFLCILFVLMVYINATEGELPNRDKLESLAHREGGRFTIGLACLLVALIIVKGCMVFFMNEDRTVIKRQVVPAEIERIAPNLSQEELVSATSNFFRGKNTTRLLSSERRILRALQAEYYNKRLPEEGDFVLSRERELHNISLVRQNTFESYSLSDSVWRGEPVFYKRILVNGEVKLSASNECYYNIDMDAPHLARGITANVNRVLKEHITKSLKSYPKLIASVLITENSSGNIVVNAAYPFDEEYPHVDYNFFPGSVKKVLLAHYFSKKHGERVDDPILHNNTVTPIEWIGRSDNEATMDVFTSHVDKASLVDFLESQHKLPYLSTSTRNGYTERGWENGRKRMMATLIGGGVRYTPMQINDWFRVIAQDAFGGNTALRRMLNAPLHIDRGTALAMASALKKKGFDPSGYICKTGTLENEKVNISTAFGIANRRYTITVLIDGRQPGNRAGLSAKDLFVKLIPEIIKFL